MPRGILTLLLLARFAVDVASAQPSPITGPPAARFLFFVESSKAMARLSPATAATVSQLVATGVSGRMQPGDAFALWHYNEEPFQFDFPATVWTPEKSPSLASDVGAFVRQLRHTKPAQSGLALREMFFAMSATDSLTVVLVNNGETPLVGTPFDLAINKSYLERADEARAQRQPFVTTLRCVNKKIVGWAVTVGKEEVVLSDAPLANVPARPLAPAPVLSPSAAATSSAATLRPTPVAVAIPTSVQTVALPAPPVAPVPSAPRIVPHTPIRDIFAIPFSQPSVPAATNASALPEAFARAAGPTNVLTILPARNAPPASPTPETTVASMNSAPTNNTLPPPLLLPLAGTNSGTVTSPMVPFRISPARTNGPPVGENLSAPLANTTVAPLASPPNLEATPATNPPRTGLGGFARKTAPTFALDGAKARPANAPPTPQRPATAAPGAPPAVEITPPRGASAPKPGALIATNLLPKPLAALAPTIDPNPKVKPVQFLLAGLITLAVAVWFIILILRGSRPRSRSSISRAIDE